MRIEDWDQFALQRFLWLEGFENISLNEIRLQGDVCLVGDSEILVFGSRRSCQ